VKKVAALLVLPVFLVGCGSQSSNYQEPPSNSGAGTDSSPSANHYKYEVPDHHHVHVSTIEVDGMKCAVYYDYGISCIPAETPSAVEPSPSY
jgi:hypothetical protein